MSEILWVGVGFDPAEDGEELSEQHADIVQICWELSLEHPSVSTGFPNGASIDEQVTPALGTVIDIFDPDGSRIGFGIRVGSIAEGKEKLSKTQEWLRAEGIVLPVSVYAWSPATDACARPRVIPEP